MSWGFCVLFQRLLKSMRSLTCLMTFRCLKKCLTLWQIYAVTQVDWREKVLFHIAVKSDIFFVKQYWSVVSNSRPPLEVRIGLWVLFSSITQRHKNATKWPKFNGHKWSAICQYVPRPPKKKTDPTMSGWPNKGSVWNIFFPQGHSLGIAGDHILRWNGWNRGREFLMNPWWVMMD